VLTMLRGGWRIGVSGSAGGLDPATQCCAVDAVGEGRGHADSARGKRGVHLSREQVFRLVTQPSAVHSSFRLDRLNKPHSSHILP
jgi:hypothetical protein